MQESNFQDESQPTESLLENRSFWGLAITQFLGAFNDNLYKQLMLLMAIGGVAGVTKDDRQGWATLAFSLPFVLFSGVAGYLSDRNSKSKIIFICKVAEIAITLLAVVAFLMYGNLGDFGTWTVLILMGVHSTFFGPAKYGILPELFHHKHLPRANGLILMSTFLAIILGVVLAGAIKDALVVKDAAGKEDYSHLWIGSLACALVAVVGTLTSLFVRYTAPVQPQARFQMVDSIVPKPIVSLLGKDQLHQADTKTSVLTAGLAIGIIIGAISANLILKRMPKDKQVTLGVLIMIVSMCMVSIWKPNGDVLLGYNGTFLGLIVAGIGAAVFVIPIQVFLQERPPLELKGRLIGTMNFANFIGILLAGPIYQLLIWVAESCLAWPVSSVFAMMAAMLVPILVFYRLPKL